MKQIKMNMKKLSRWWKAFAVLFVVVTGVVIMTKFASAETVQVNITGQPLDSGTWEVGDNPVIWTAEAYDSEADEILSLEDGGTVIWESSDRNIVDFTSSTNGTQSTVSLEPISAGKVTISATYTKTVNTDEGSYEVRAESKRTIIVKFRIDSTRIPQTPVEDDYIIPTVLSNSAKPVTWSSSNESVVTVSDDGSGNGIINIAGAGKAIVTAVSEDGQRESFPVVVNAKFLETTLPINVKYNEYYTLTTNAARPSNVVFESANPRIVSVDSDGSAKGVSAGRTTLQIYAVGNDDPWYSLLPSPARYVPVKVDFEIMADSNIAAVGDTVLLSSNMDPEYATAINWTSSDTSVATVDERGVVTAVRKGTVTINANVVNEELFGTTDLQKAEIRLEVVDSFALSEAEHIMNVGDSFELSAIVTDQAANVTWATSDESVATVTVDRRNNKLAVVKGIKKGTAIITATQIIDGVSKTATCEVSITEPVQNVSIEPSEIEINRGSQYRLIVNFTPSRPDNMNVTWVSSNERIVTVDDMGVIKGIRGGQAVVSVVSEDGIKVASCTVSVREPVTSIKLDVNRVTASLGVGTYQLTYKILPDGDGVNRNVTWTSSAPDIATVGENGLVTFKKPGKATIVVKTVDIGVSGNLIDTCEFYINNPVTAVDLDYTNITLRLSEQFRLTAKVTPDDATDKTILWSSSDTNVATVDESGMVTAVGSGSATILAKSQDSGATSMCNVTVYQPVTSVVISNDTMTVRKGTEFWLNAKALPENAMNKEILWTSSDEEIAKVDENGKVTTLQAGDCVITATSKDSGVAARCALTVTQPITGIYLNVNEKTILKGEKFLIIPTITPLDADNKNVTFTSSDPSVAEVDATGIVTGLKGGVAVIVVKTEERGLVASCQVTVQEFVSSVDITQNDMRIGIGEVRLLSANVLAETATNRRLAWSSSNSGIVSVDETGKITANGIGRAIVYASATDGSGMFDTISIEVVRPVTSISISPSGLSIPEGKSSKVSVNVSPADATYKDVEWSSSDNTVAIVDTFGEITGLKAGTCKVTATATDGSGIVGTCKVTVTPTIPATGITINSKSVTMLPGQTRKLNARIKPTKSTESVFWVSGDTSVATVSEDGTVTARGQGNTEIYAVSNETGIESSCEVIVLALNATSITLEQYDSFDLDVFGATERIKWYSNNKRVATVSANGQVIARMAGTTTITAKVNGKVLYCTVRVTNMK